MNVRIIKLKTRRVVATVPVSLGGLNYCPSDRELFEEAWRCAVEDAAVVERDRDAYSFTIAQ